jgi:ribosome-associated translation inhibitor RaiA
MILGLEAQVKHLQEGHLELQGENQNLMVELERKADQLATQFNKHNKLVMDHQQKQNGH